MPDPKYIVAYPPVDFSVPFPDVRPEDIDIYFHYTNEIGAATCRAACAHCYFRNRPDYRVPMDLALAVTRSVKAQGYNIGMVPADSFAEEALTVGATGSAFRLRETGLLAWSSGVPLATPGWERRLNRGWDIGFRSIVITAHEAAGTTVPIKGVTKVPFIVQALANIQAWNERNVPKRFGRAVTFTIRRDNCSYEQIAQMASWGVCEGLDLVRFNCFANFQGLAEHRQFEMTRSDIERFFGILARIQAECYGTRTAFGISEDWGDAGIEQITASLPPVWRMRRTGWCRAGYRLFAMIEVDGEIVVTGCVDKWDPILGRVREEGGMYRIDWDVERIELIRRAVLEQRVYACWGGVGCQRPGDAGFQTDAAAEAAIPWSPRTL